MLHRVARTLAFAAALLLPGNAFAAIRVAASTNDLASIAASIGGVEVEVFSIARPTSDVHRVEILPSTMVRVSRARLYLKVGLGLDAWADGIIDGSRNERLTVVDCSEDVPVLERPIGKVDASMGDVHPNGNPHYWLDPRNGAIVARTIAEALARVDGSRAADYRARAETFAKEAEAAWRAGRSMADRLPVKTMITYHRSWTYFGNAFGIEIAGTAEPVPGIPPTAKHLGMLVSIAKGRRIPVFLCEPYFSADAGRFLARESGVRVVTASPSCDAPTAGSYLNHFRTLLAAFTEGS